MRPYRGIHNGGWKYGYHSYDFMRNEDVIVNSQGSWPVIPETIGQQVGKQDAKGQDIYEGDIIVWDIKQVGIWPGQDKPEVVKYPFVCGNAHLGNIIGTIHDAEAEDGNV